MTRRLNIARIAVMILASWTTLAAASVSAATARGYALWCNDNKTLYFTKADAVPNKYLNHTVNKAWEVNDANTHHGVAAPAWITDHSTYNVNVANDVITVVIDRTFSEVTPSGFYSWFHGCKNLTTIEGLAFLNTSGAGYMNKMFYGCESLQTINLHGVDMSTIFNTTMMFYGCSSLKTIYGNDTWQPSHSAQMFGGCEQLQGDVAFDSNHTDGSMATSVGGYFMPYTSHTYALMLEEPITRNYYMHLLISPYEINSGDTHDGMTVEMVKTLSNTPETWSTELEYFNRSWYKGVVIEPSMRGVRLRTLEGWFRDFSSMSSIIGLDNLNTTDLLSVRGMFENCSSLTSLDLSTLDLSNVQDFGYMFSRCYNLKTLILDGIDTSNATDMEYMFAQCKKLTPLNLPAMNTGKVTSMKGLLEGCQALSEIDLSTVSTASVTNMESMFAGCTGLTTLDVNTFDMTKVTTTASMFQGCSSLGTIYCENTWNMATSDNMFLGCSSLYGYIPYDADKTDGTYANPTTGYFYSRVNPPTYDPQGRYIIRSAADWEAFAAKVNNDGMTSLGAVMVADVNLGSSQVMVGNDDHNYSGTFDGNGHTLNIAYVATDQGCAPFHHVNGCNIQNLHVTGTIDTDKIWAAGLIGNTGSRADVSYGAVTITKCWSSVTINSTINGAGHHGGFVGLLFKKTNITITNCLFDGIIIGANTSGCSGFIGEVASYTGSSNITSCLMHIKTVGFDTSPSNYYASGPFYSFLKRLDGDDDYVNGMQIDSYYTTKFGSTSYQGTDISGKSISEIIPYYLDSRNWQITDGQPALKY